MIKILKIIILVAVGSTLCLIVFFFYAKSGSIDADHYHQVKNYSIAGDSQSDTFSLMTYNIGYLSGMTNNKSTVRDQNLFIDNLQKARLLLDQYKPDIIGFQEIDFNASRSLEINQLDSLAFKTSYSSGLQSINWDKKYVPFPYWPPQHQFGKIVSGQAILSVYNISNIEVMILEKPINAPFYYNSLYIDRLIQVASIQINGRQVTLMNLHLEAFHEETRIRHAGVAKEIFEKYANLGPVLLFGDFNSQPVADTVNTSAIEIIMQSKGIQSVLTTEAYLQSPKNYFTYSSAIPDRMIDHIFYTEKDFAVIESKVLSAAGEISDHLPFYAQLVLIRDENSN